MTALVQTISPASTQRVHEPAGLAQLYQPGTSLVLWRRGIPLALAALPAEARGLKILAQGGARTLAEALSLPRGPFWDALRADVLLLVELLTDLFEADSLGLRLIALDAAMCPRFHVDRILARLSCTYGGPGTEWIDTDSLPHLRPGDALDAEVAARPALIQRAAPHEVVLMKGDAWPGEEGHGAIHRSPSLAPNQTRLLLTLEPF